MDRSIKGLLVSVYFVSFNLLHNTIFGPLYSDFVSFMFFFFSLSLFSFSVFSSLLFIFVLYFTIITEKKITRFVPFFPLDSVRKALNKMSMACHTRRMHQAQGLMGIHRPSKGNNSFGKRSK